MNFSASVKNTLRKYGISPSKGLGQNFLVDKFAVKRVVLAAELTNKDIVLEIGPGLGALTQELAKRVRKVIAVEKDKRMIEALGEILKGFKNVEIINRDILKLENLKLIENLKLKIKDFKVVANLPFYLTAPLIRQFLEQAKVRPLSMTLVVQKEVAQRICAKPPQMNLLAVSVQFYAEPKILDYIPKTSFWPKPKVDSAIIKIIPQKFANTFTEASPHLTTRSISQNSASDELFNKRFFEIVRAGFSQPRKQLVNNLSKKLQLDKEKTKSWLLKTGIKPISRAESLSLENWLTLTKNHIII